MGGRGGRFVFHGCGLSETPTGPDNYSGQLLSQSEAPKTAVKKRKERKEVFKKRVKTAKSI